MKIKILVVTHKRYQMPSESMYVPIQSGSALYDNLGYLRDDSGDNISIKNAAYNELCPLYWAWKNLDEEYIGLVHYRRHLGIKKFTNDINDVLSLSQVEDLLKKTDIILPIKRNYYYESIYKHYVNSQKNRNKMHLNDIKILREIINENYPDYLESFNKIMKSKKAHMFHIFIMKSDKFNEYCEFIFNIAFKLEERLSDKRMDKTRYIGALTEFLMDVWIDKNNYSYIETNIIELERKNIITRSLLMLKRKFINHDVKL